MTARPRAGSVTILFVALMCAVALLTGTAHAQESFVTLPGGERISLSDGSVAYVHDAQTGTTTVERYDPNEEKAVIVQFQARPTALAPAGVLQKRGDVEGEHADFRAALRDMQLRFGKNAVGVPEAVITHEYLRIFNGAAVRGPAGVVDRLHHLPMVRTVRPDFEVRIALDASVAQIGADRVHEELGLTGEGVRVCIVDTGIDYDHPALGGGFGPGFRVVGGYDFVNDDADPMDGHGHGTHVAGIVGARSDSLLGVAPGVTFLAAKVLSDGGGGTASSIIAGIEYCVDPDGDPATDDGAAIINMSLGGPATADSPVDVSVDNASAAGVLSVVAAGNSGIDFPGRSSFGTIGSPATAARALSVGAVDSMDTIADFSSKGPGPFDDAIKPEIVAPGVAIRSSVTGGATDRFSGTSMAAPHVAGAAALLKELHPNWTADDLKWRLVNAARPASEDGALPYVYGNGVLDAWRATQAEVTVSPGVLSFGAVDLEEPIWRDTLRFTVANHADEPRRFQLDAPRSLPGGATLTLSEADFVLASREEQTVTAVLAVDESVPTVEEAPFAYSSVVHLTSEHDTVRLPMGFVKAHTLALELEVPAWLVLVYDPQAARHYRMINLAGGTQRMHMSAGRYDLFTIMQEQAPDGLADFYFVQKRGIEVEGLTPVGVAKEEAHVPIFSGQILGGDGRPPERYARSVGVEMSWFYDSGQRSSYSFGFFWNQENPIRIWSSSLDKRYDIGRRLIGARGDRVMALGGIHRGGLNDAAELHIPSGPENLTDVRVDFVHRDDPSVDRRAAVSAQTHSYDRNSSSMSSMYMHFDSLRVATVSLGASDAVLDEQDGFLEYVAYGFGMSEAIGADGGMGYRLTETSTIDVAGDGQLGAHAYPLSMGQGRLFGDRVDYHRYQPGDTVVVRPWYQDVLLPVYYAGYYGDATRSNLLLESGHLTAVGGVITPSGQRNPHPFAQPEHQFPQVQSRLFHRNRIHEAEEQAGFFGVAVFEDIFGGDEHRQDELLRVVGETLPYTLLGQSGHTVLDTELHVGEDGTVRSPSLEVLQILADGRLAQWVRPGERGLVRLIVNDQGHTLTDVGIALLLSDGTVRLLETDALSSSEYVAELPQDLHHAYIDVRVRVRTAEEHRFELTAAPAFFYGSSLDERQFDSRIYLRSYELTNAQESPIGLLAYDLTLANTGNVTAHDIEISVPEADLIRSAAAMPVRIDQLDPGEETTVQILVQLREPLTEPTYFAPAVTWTSDERAYARGYRILVDDDGLGRDSLDLDDQHIGASLILHPGFPNPFSHSTTLAFDLGQSSDVHLAVYDVLGRRVAVLLDGRRDAGRHTVEWVSNAQLASGVYYVRLVTDAGTKTGRLLLLR